MKRKTEQVLRGGIKMNELIIKSEKGGLIVTVPESYKAIKPK